MSWARESRHGFKVSIPGPMMIHVAIDIYVRGLLIISVINKFLGLNEALGLRSSLSKIIIVIFR